MPRVLRHAGVRVVYLCNAVYIIKLDARVVIKRCISGDVEERGIQSGYCANTRRQRLAHGEFSVCINTENSLVVDMLCCIRAAISDYRTHTVHSGCQRGNPMRLN